MEWIFVILAIAAYAYWSYQKQKREEEEFMNMSPEQQNARLIENYRKALSTYHKGLVYAQEKGDTVDIAHCRAKIAEIESRLRELGA